MRASLGVRVGPAYIGTGNLLRTRRRRRRGGGGVLMWFVVWPIVGMFMLAAFCFWWAPRFIFRGIASARRQRQARALQTAPRR